MTVYGTGPITIRHERDYSSVNYGGSDYDVIPSFYLLGWREPNYPVPAVRNVLNVIAAISCDAATDFLDIGMCGKL